MSATRVLTVLLLLLLTACPKKPAPIAPAHVDEHIAAAAALTHRYARSRLAEWNVHAAAAGRDCHVLLVETGVIMEDGMVEALHYGLGAYDVLDGGVRHFSRARAFRGVAYRDSTGRIWTYGEVTADEAKHLAVCR
jgi:hypothetical protein